MTLFMGKSKQGINYHDIVHEEIKAKYKLPWYCSLENQSRV